MICPHEVETEDTLVSYRIKNPDSCPMRFPALAQIVDLTEIRVPISRRSLAVDDIVFAHDMATKIEPVGGIGFH